VIAKDKEAAAMKALQAVSILSPRLAAFTFP
jgi:hypothetical protein